MLRFEHIGQQRQNQKNIIPIRLGTTSPMTIKTDDLGLLDQQFTFGTIGNSADSQEQMAINNIIYLEFINATALIQFLYILYTMSVVRDSLTIYPALFFYYSGGYIFIYVSAPILVLQKNLIFHFPYLREFPPQFQSTGFRQFLNAFEVELSYQSRYCKMSC